jgi:hypothetical protein
LFLRCGEAGGHCGRLRWKSGRITSIDELRRRLTETGYPLKFHKKIRR